MGLAEKGEHMESFAIYLFSLCTIYFSYYFKTIIPECLALAKGNKKSGILSELIFCCLVIRIITICIPLIKLAGLMLIFISFFYLIDNLKRRIHKKYSKIPVIFYISWILVFWLMCGLFSAGYLL